MAKLIAYSVSNTNGWELVRGGPARGWMDKTPHRFAYRCLPLTVANQAGWQILCPIDFTAVWNGGDREQDLAIAYPPGAAEPERFGAHINGHFGCGILTFALPWLFRTEPGINLLARGAPNHLKANCVALEGLVETDWSVATFTMNWKMMVPDAEVVFRKGEPICFMQPIRADIIESTQPIMANIDSDPALKREYDSWRMGRIAFNADMSRPTSAWQKHYHRGVTSEGTTAESHRTALKLADFVPVREEDKVS